VFSGGGSLKASKNGLRRGLQIERGARRGFCRSHCTACLFSEHLAVAGRLGVTCRYARGRGLRRTACGGVAGLMRRRLGDRSAFAVLVCFKAAIDFLLPGRCKVGFDRGCTQSSNVPSGTGDMGPRAGPLAVVAARMPHRKRGIKAIRLKKDKGVSQEYTVDGLSRRWRSFIFRDDCLLPETLGARPINWRPLLLC
jgi:hypothetical protein